MARFEDVWKNINSFNRAEGWRMRWCRGCKHLGSAGALLCCDCYEHTGKRRGCPIGKGCDRREPLKGYTEPPGYRKWCDGEPPPKREQGGAGKPSFVKPKEAPARTGVLANEPPPPNVDRKNGSGRWPTWDVEWAWHLFFNGYLLREIAEIIGAPQRTIGIYSASHEWRQYRPKSVKSTQHDNLDAEKAEYRNRMEDIGGRKPK